VFAQRSNEGYLFGTCYLVLGYFSFQLSNLDCSIFFAGGKKNCPSVLPQNLRVFVENSGKKIPPKIVSAYRIWSKEFEKNFIFDKSA
jgi:hypothetical protein